MKTLKLSALTMLFAMFAISFANAQCPAPTGLSSVSLSTTSAELNWTSSGGATSYSINIENGQNNPTPFLITGNPSSNTFTASGLTAGLVYKFKVRTRCGGNKSNWSNWHQFVAGGGSVNCVPLTGLTVSSINSTGASFNWNVSQGGLGYAIRVEDASGNPIDFAFNSVSTTNSYVMSGLNASSNYKVKIRKRCAVGVTGPWSPWVFFTTSALRTATFNNGTSADENVLIYPNPANDYFTIEPTGTEKINAFQIYDMTGKLVYSQNVSTDENSNFTKVSTIDFNNGIYQLNIQTSNQTISRKIVISK